MCNLTPIGLVISNQKSQMTVLRKAHDCYTCFCHNSQFYKCYITEWNIQIYQVTQRNILHETLLLQLIPCYVNHTKTKRTQ